MATRVASGSLEVSRALAEAGHEEAASPRGDGISVASLAEE